MVRRWQTRAGILGAAMLTLRVGGATAETTFTADPEAGHNAFTAVFDAAIGERITAVSSAIGCTLTVDEAAHTGRAACKVALPAVRVDNDDVKSDHFRQWATNNASEPKRCTITVEVPQVAIPAQVEGMKPVTIDTTGTVTICGRGRDDKGREAIAATVTLLPVGAYNGNTSRILRVRAKIEDFQRERYKISPKDTNGWLARVQQLAPVVAASGTIEVNLFAVEVTP